MSVAACRVYPDKIVIGADSYSARGDLEDGSSYHFAKIRKIGDDLIIAGVGVFHETILFWMYAEEHKPFAPEEYAMMRWLIEFRKWRKEQGNEDKMDNAYLIIYKGKAFYSYETFVAEIDNYYSVGAGDTFAMAAMYLGHAVEEALDAACEHNCYCRKPLVLMEVKKDDRSI